MKQEITTILAIETSLDDTCAAVTREDRVLSNIVASQVAFHEEWGGTVPDIAKRMHLKWIDRVVDDAVLRSGLRMADIDAIAVTVGPGLAPSLEVGIDKAEALSVEHNLPLIPVNHLEGHLLACIAKNSKGTNHQLVDFPALGFVISGGHTELVLINQLGSYKLLGQTLDDAAGEAYDKVARMLKLGYPGGPILSNLALEGKPIYKLPIPMTMRHDLNFSFSGLKTAAMNKLKELESVPHDRQFVCDFAASFQEAALKHLMKRFEKAIKCFQPRSVLLGGGVVSNITLREAARKVAREYKLKVIIPYNKKLFTDNAAMIGITAWHQAQRTKSLPIMTNLDRQPNLNFPKSENLGL